MQTSPIQRIGGSDFRYPLLLSAPHAGEFIPTEGAWLSTLPALTLLCDADRFVDQLYLPIATSLGAPLVMTQINRYVADLNRLPTDVDADSVQGSANPSGKFTSGFHWVKTVTGERLMNQPISKELHDRIVNLYSDPFHALFKKITAEVRVKTGATNIFHLDCHSMPSQGSAMHKDNGAPRADVVISDCEGKSAASSFKDAVISAFQKTGWSVAYNWPYQGGRITQVYGRPSEGHHTIQIELNRRLYMNEVSKEKLSQFENVRETISGAIREIAEATLKLKP